MIDLAALRRANPLPEVAGRLVALRSSRSEWLGLCPFHRERSPSFTIFDGGQRFHCFGCAASGDVLDFVRRAYGVSLPEAARLLGAGAIPRAALPESGERHGQPEQGRNRRLARQHWASAIPAAGTPAEAYLRLRGIMPPYPSDIRFLPLACDDLGPLPCLIAGVRDVGGDIAGIQRIWLASDGRGKAAVARPKRSLGQVKGGAIRLGDPGPGGALTVCEGPEDGLSLLAMLGGAVWVAAGASFLPAMQLPGWVRSVTVAADNDPAGESAAQAAAGAFAAQGIAVRILRPLPAFKDFNDELRGAA